MTALGLWELAIYYGYCVSKPQALLLLLLLDFVLCVLRFQVCRPLRISWMVVTCKARSARNEKLIPRTNNVATKAASGQTGAKATIVRQILNKDT
jgi:hypothetical protein